MAVHWMDSIINLEYQTVGVEIIEQPISYISVYPNPASDKLTINYQLKKSAVVNIYLIDLQGKQHIVLHKETNAMGIQTESMDISELPPGIYFLRLQAGNDVVTKKIVKL
jgi:pectinesterase